MYEHSPKKGRRKIVSREHLLNIGFFFGEKLGFDVDRDHSSGIFSGFIHGLEANSITFRWVPMAMSGDVGMWFVWMADGWLDRWVLCISIELTNHVFLTSGQPHHFYFTAAGGNMKETRMIIHLKRRFLKLDIESWLQGPLLFFTFGVDCFAKCFFLFLAFGQMVSLLLILVVFVDFSHNFLPMSSQILFWGPDSEDTVCVAAKAMMHCCYFVLFQNHFNKTTYMRVQITVKNAIIANRFEVWGLFRTQDGFRNIWAVRLLKQPLKFDRT